MTKNKITSPFLVACLAAFALSAHAESQTSWYDTLQAHLSEVWDRADHTDLYVPLLTYHNRSMYSQEKIDAFNEQPWGLGLGKSYRDEHSNWDGYYVMAFKDSHNDWEPILGYGHVKNLYGTAKQLNAGLGLTAGFTARSDFNYKPLPVLLPIAAMGYDVVTVNATYVPGTKGNGNVLFMWSTVAF